MEQLAVSKTKNTQRGFGVANTLAVVGLFVLCLTLPGLASVSSDPSTTVSAQIAVPRPTPPDQPLDEEAASALVDELKATLSDSINDEDAVNSIGEKWAAKNLTGKTRSQIFASLFADVKSVVEDKAAQNQVWESWKNIGLSPETETPEPKATPVPKADNPDEDKDVPEKTTPDEDPKDKDSDEEKIDPEKTTPPDTTPKPPDSTEPTGDMIDLGAPPLSDGEMDQVMTWIATRTGALRLPFCWKQSFGRGAGEPLTGRCADGLDQNGLLCYPKCKDNYAGNGPVCWGKCPTGFNDIGAFCQKPAPYGRGAGYAVWNEQKCNTENSIGCEKWGAMWYPKCKPGFHNVAANICSPDCPTGYSDTGTGCTKPNYGRGAGEPFACKPGTERNGLLCYPTCKNGYAGNGPVCWQKCPSQQSWDCGAACSTNQKECGFAVLKQVTAPIMAVISIVSLGSASAATGGVKAAAKAAELAVKAGKLAQAAAKIKKAAQAVGGNIETLVGGAKNLAKIKQVSKVGGKVYVAASAVGREVDLFSKEFADNFDEWTSPEIGKEIDRRFGPEAAFQVKRQWGLRHLSMMLEVDGFAAGKNVLSLVSIADPTGLVAVGEAFMHPVCKSDSPFPKVTLLYDR